MENKILKLQNHRPHLTIPLIDGNVLIVPALYIEDIIAGKQKFKTTKESNILARTIIKEWYENVKNDN